jgi:hypothetical protein
MVTIYFYIWLVATIAIGVSAHVAIQRYIDKNKAE